MSGVSTFAIFQQLLQQSVNKNSSLDAATQASMTTYIAVLSKTVLAELTFANAESFSGAASIDEALKSIRVATAALGTNRVEFEEIVWTVCHTVDGTKGEIGALIGHGGNSPDPLLATSDITMEYRLSSSDTWKAFDRQTLLTGITRIQFAVDIADQGSDATLPSLAVVAYQE